MGLRENPKMKTQEAETPESTTLFKIFCEQGGQAVWAPSPQAGTCMVLLRTSPPLHITLRLLFS